MNKSKPVVVSGKFRDFVTDLNERAGVKGHMPFIGREDELEAVMETLLRKLKNNLLLVGKPGVGKTALITELARRINRGDVPPFLRGKIVLGLSVNAFVYSKDSLDPLINDFERFFSEMKQNRERIILFLDDMQMQTLVGTHKQRQFSHFEGLLKTHIADRELTVIAAASSEDYVRYIKSDEIFSSNFSTICSTSLTRRRCSGSCAESGIILRATIPWRSPSAFSKISSFFPSDMFPIALFPTKPSTCSTCPAPRPR